MPIISARDNENNRGRETKKQKKRKTEKKKGDKSYSERMRVK